MKTRILYFGALVLALGLSSCSNESTETPEKEGEEICLYTFDTSSSELEFTSFKTNAKVPVKGTFNKIEITGAESEIPEEVIKSLEFSIGTSSVETNDEGRNAKIAEFFFGTISTPEITGNVKSINLEEGQAVVSITMNGIEVDVEGTCTFEDDVFTFTSSIDVSDWNGLPGIEALNKACEDLHTGEDGISKLWSEVGLSFKGRLKSDCGE